MAIVLADPPTFREEAAPAEPTEDKLPDRLERWKRRLLDLTLRNKLLNFKPGKNAIAVECVDAGALEDRLAAGRSFKLMPRSDVFDGSDERSRALFEQRHLDDGRRRYLTEALARDEIYTTLPAKELDDRLLDLFRLVRNGFEEGGANILFLAIGFLIWTRKDGETPYRAPLLLVPVSLKRASVRAGFRLALHDDDARFNPTLTELLRQEFDLRIPGLAGDLPRDGSGLDVDHILAIVRSHVRDLKGWEVVPDVVLSAFSFSKFLMWRDLVERSEVLKRNPVVRHLLDTPTHSYGDGSPFPEPGRLDHEYRADAVFAPLSADSSQLSAVMAAAGGKDFVLFGPPGTGKSQTIGNMIAQCLAAGRTVLFVSQKTAALEVVQRRLDAIGLGEYALAVHSAKAQKTSVLAQLKSAWHDRQAPSDAGWTEATADLQRLRDELNGLVIALHRRRENGMSVYEAFGRVIGGDRKSSLALDWSGHEVHSPETLASVRGLCRDLHPVLDAVGIMADHPLSGMGAFEWSPRWHAEIGTALSRFAVAKESFRDTAGPFAAALGFEPLLETHSGTRALVVLGHHLARPSARTGRVFLLPDAGDLKAALVEREQFRQAMQRRTAGLQGRYRPSIYDQDLPALLSGWLDAQSANFLTRGGKTRRVQLQVGLHVEGVPPTDLGPDLITLIDVDKHLRAGCLADAVLARFGHPWTDDDEAQAQFGHATAWADKAQQIIDVIAMVLPDSSNLRERLAALAANGGVMAAGQPVRAAFDAVGAAWNALALATKELNRLAGLAPDDAPLAAGPGWIAAGLDVARRWQSGLGRAATWSAWQSAAHQAREAGLSPLVTAVEIGTVAPTGIERAFETAYARWWSDRVVSDDPVLRRFLPQRHEDAIARFRELDARVTELSKRIVRSRLAGGIPGPTSFGSDPEWGLLSAQLVKKRNHLPIRQLFGRIPTALTRLTPCLMMSPLSIAQYLPPESNPFDVVIFDEASQISPWDAVGAIARGKQVVIVGDPEQLPPTNVGDRGVDDIEDGTDVADQESILDECLAANIPRRNLDWHYRSRHESLIAFSNARYYGGRLVTFPSPVTTDRAVRLIHVPDGLYERGSSNRVNRPEARTVVAEIVHRLKDPNFAAERLSLGVVTFNSDQQRLIENLLDAERRAHPDLEPFFDGELWPEPVFVKNLENVQGDERDVIIFSVAVGPDAAGRVSTTVSSLNKEGGHRRLNVAITRARRELVVFASLRPEQINLSRTGSRGVRDFKHFLEFADRGARALAEAAAPTGRDTDSPFEDAVLAALVARGWTVHPQVGASGFRIDLGVVHPDEPGRYLAGVECDGATYHRSATARDRDRLREMVLTNLGWRIRRVWSTEWWSDATAAFDKLEAGLRADLADDRRRWTPVREPASSFEERTQADPDVTNSVPEAPPQVVPSQPGARTGDVAAAANDPAPPVAVEEPPRIYADHVLSSPEPVIPSSAVSQLPAYGAADPTDCGHVLDPERFYEPSYRPVLAAAVAHVLATEAPIFEDLLVRRIARAHGFGRTGSIRGDRHRQSPCSDSRRRPRRPLAQRHDSRRSFTVPPPRRRSAVTCRRSNRRARWLGPGTCHTRVRKRSRSYACHRAWPFAPRNRNAPPFRARDNYCEHFAEVSQSMTSFTFIHAADLHLGSPLGGLASRSAELAQRFTSAGRAAFSALIDHAIETKVAFMVVAGDIYDGDWADHAIGLFFAREIGRLERAGIPFAYVRGNHDAESVMLKSITLPASVMEFPSGKAAIHLIASLRVALHGRSFPARNVPDDFVASYGAPREGWFNIGLLHTDCGGHPNHATYAPCSVAELVAKGYDYWALGHVHDYVELSRDPHIIFPGNLQGRSIRECGPRGAVAVDVVDGRVADVRRIVMDKARFAHLDLNVGIAASEPDIHEIVVGELHPHVAEAENRPIALRITLRGATVLHDTLAGNPDRVVAELQAAAHRVHEEVWLEKVRIRTTRPARPSDAVEGRLDPTALLAELHRDGDVRARAAALIADIKAKLPGGMASSDDGEFGDNLDELMIEAEATIMARLTDRGR